MFLAKCLLLCTACVLVMGQPTSIPEFRKLEGQDLIDAEQLLETTLAKIDGPHYRLLSVVKAEIAQLVVGPYYKFTAALVDENNLQKECQVNIWNIPIVRVVTVKCPNEPELRKELSA
ncbi:hypothetical protein KR026_001782 [Drosophila bipectinata]|nr:hypothetical protein KR026_001782 [Drosophila bipectinata]